MDPRFVRPSYSDEQDEAMRHEGVRTLLRVFLLSTDKSGWWVTARDALLTQALQSGLEGGTLLEGAIGVIHGQATTTTRFALVQHRPTVLEFLDSPRVIGGFLTEVRRIAPQALCTVEGVYVLAYRRRQEEAEAMARRYRQSGGSSAAQFLPDSQEFAPMRSAVDGQLLRVFLDETDSYESRPLYEVVLEQVRAVGISNAVLFRAPKGFGAHQRIHDASQPDYLSDLPLLIEVVGTSEEIGRLLPFLDGAMPEGLVTIENVKMLLPRR